MDKPVLVKTEHHDNIRTEAWVLDGELHNDDGPAKLTIYKNNNTRCYEYYQHGKCFRADGPAVITEAGNSKRPTTEIWYTDPDVEQMHREGGPAFIEYGNATERTEMWYKHGEVYRDGDLPTLTHQLYFGNRDEIWATDIFGLTLHRETGPSYILYDKDGDIISQKWHLNGTEYNIFDLKDYVDLPEEDKVALKLAFG